MNNADREAIEWTSVDWDLSEHLEAWVVDESGAQLMSKGGLTFWDMPNAQIHLGTVATETPFLRQGVASRLFDDVLRKRPMTKCVLVNLGSKEGEALLLELKRRYPEIAFDLRCEGDGGPPPCSF